MATYNTPGVSKAPRGDCSTCRGDYALTAAGVIRKHILAGDTCDGSGKPPKGAGK